MIGNEAIKMAGYIDPTKETFVRFRESDRAGPIHMLNLVRLRERAAYPDGRSVSGAEAYAAYGRDSGPVFTRLGGRVDPVSQSIQVFGEIDGTVPELMAGMSGRAELAPPK